jgi:deoxyguanosine kinase
MWHEVMLPQPPEAWADEALVYSAGRLEFRYIAIEGAPGLEKTRLAQRLGARLDGSAVLEDRHNPFLADYYAGRPGAGFQAQLFFTLARHRQLLALRQRHLFTQTTVCDYLFERDQIYAFANLDDNELFIHQRLFELVSRDLATPDVVIYLQAPTDLLIRRWTERVQQAADDGLQEPAPDAEYLAELNEGYNHFFFHYSASPLLVVEASQLDLSWPDDTVDDLLRQLRTMAGGTRYYVPRT